MFESHLRLFWRLNPLTKKISFSRGQRWNVRSYIWQMSPCLSLARSWWEFTLTEWHQASWVRSWHGFLLAARRNFLRFNQNLDTSQESAGAGNHLRASLPHPMIMTFLFLHHNSRKGPHMAGDELFWWENMKWSLFRYNWFSPHYNPCQTVLQREDINSEACQPAGRELQVLTGS